MAGACTARGHLPHTVPCCATSSPFSSPFFSWRFQTGAQVNEPGGGSQAKDKRAQDAERCSCGVSIPKSSGRGKKDAKDSPTHLLLTTASKCCLSSHCTLESPALLLSPSRRLKPPLLCYFCRPRHPQPRGAQMESVQELIPLAKEVMAQKPRGKLVKLYVLGSVLALFGVVLGLVETVCSPFTAASRLRDQEAAVTELREACEQQSLHKQALLGRSKAQEATLSSRVLSLRQHAS
ncbi:G0/G1 switch protein 2 [Lemmus lemmus]